MTKEEIIRMAREAGLFTHKDVQPEILAFANLVAAHEREACAAICEEEEELRDHTPFDCTLRIRARGML